MAKTENNNGKLNPEDMKAGYDSAMGDVKAVGDELSKLGNDMRFKILDGKDRQEFINTMTEEEFSMLHFTAQKLGPRGLAALERIVNEAQ